MCIQNLNLMGPLGRGDLKFKDFKKFVDSYPVFRTIEVSNFGEIFLNPELGNIIKYAYKKNVALIADNGVNLNTASDKILEALVKFRFKSMIVSIDGSGNDTYQIYRRRGNFDNVIENIKKINFYKRRYKSEFPRLKWQFVLFDHNIHEVSLASKMAHALHMGFIKKFNWEPKYSPIQNTGQLKRIMHYSSCEDREQKTRTTILAACRQLWSEPQINWDGRLLGCCCNWFGDFGNVFESGLKACMESERYVYAKKMLLDKAPPRKDIPCYACAHFQYKRARNTSQILYGELRYSLLTPKKWIII